MSAASSSSLSWSSSSSSWSRDRCGSFRRHGPVSSRGSVATADLQRRTEPDHTVSRADAPADRPARAGRQLPAAAGHHRGQPRRQHRHRHLLPGHRPRAATYEIANYIQAIEQLTVTTLRNVVGGMDLERRSPAATRSTAGCAASSTRRPESGGCASTASRSRRSTRRTPSKSRWSSRCARTETSEPPILTAEGVKQSQILTAEGEKQSAILSAQGHREAEILRAEGQAKAIATVFDAIHAGNPDPALLAYQYLESLPKVASYGNTVIVVPAELTTAMQKITEGFNKRD